MHLSIIGAGNVGATAAYCIAKENIVDSITLIDIVDSVKGKALDMQQSMAIYNSNTSITGTTETDVTDSDIIVITAGKPRQPGKTREDLLEENKNILKGILQKVKEQAPNALVIIVTNPLDLMVAFAAKELGFPRERVIGMAGTLDSARFRHFIAEKTTGKVEGIVIGSHNDKMIPIISQATVEGKPLTDILSREDIAAIIDRTKKGGAEVSSLYQTGSAYFATGAAIMQLVKAIATDSKEALPASVMLQGEYGISDVCIGVPCMFRANGATVVELPLAAEELQALRESALQLKQLFS